MNLARPTIPFHICSLDILTSSFFLWYAAQWLLMEAVNSAASVVAFATVALNGIKELFKATSAFQDGPEDVAQLIEATQELQQLISRLLSLLTTSGFTIPATFANELKKSFKACEQHVKIFDAKLRRCQPVHGDGSLHWLLARLRPVTYRSDLEKMRLLVLRHLAVFSVHAGIANK
ncbi:hypothetical protein CLAFUW4_02702 [Fulvia fulva]|uniref:Azaphilone pigments biosynthesis cluster protein L N-terminal domain-containing protein n=1 Tax=Passalora fulva TaxID=5499 RepID=A0A9Q8LAZ8_PASFU|nr:uncharacterized protein CLAFUR5_02690 [Fulvia fulva]KAK4631061.1 hypothetical protein CLAFUR4_02697 [Fulvia fulva]KAK4633674.1 hypothetical protein CLAFUR0_02699 [Fulvia fulva]UJO14067.1 hypothetical protein CLAFUR5_02690 [Fulvia fulva]WPV12009.1 hypothetical protein CLAFUW4_02702 [Fulvia fulva]WPV25905.1 hypothetical protein CLAFUW7_02701 [Fulvia fulva]